jgi:hypothetical protein
MRQNLPFLPPQFDAKEFAEKFAMHMLLNDVDA